jgi:hypothetical protein
LWDPDAWAEDEELAEIDLLEPNGSPSQGYLPKMGELLPRPQQTGKIRVQ